MVFKSMNISLIITTYNRPDALEKVLDGLKLQTRMPAEIIIADDGSGRETEQAVEDGRQDMPVPMEHVWQDDQGFRAAGIRNKAIVKASGDYIILLDGDCIPGKHFIADHLKLAKPGYFYQGKRILVNKKASNRFTCRDANALSRLVALSLKRQIANRHHMIRIPFFPVLSSSKMSGIKSCNMGIFRKDLFAVNGFNENFKGWGREDSELVARLYKFGLKRKDHPFMAACFHLWHRENSRERLSYNDELLERGMTSGDFFTLNGLVKKDE